MATLSKIRLSATSRVYKEMVSALLKSPMSFFETVHTGQIISRLSGDFYNIEVPMHTVLNRMFAGWILALEVVGFMVYRLPASLMAVCLMVPICYFAGKFYLGTAGQLMRSAADSRAVVFGQIGETAQGIQTVRAFGKNRYFWLVGIRHSAPSDRSIKFKVLTRNSSSVTESTYTCKRCIAYMLANTGCLSESI